MEKETPLVTDQQKAEGLGLDIEEGYAEKLPTVTEARAKFDQIDGAPPPKKIPQAAEVKPDILPTLPKPTITAVVGSKGTAPVPCEELPIVPAVVPEVKKKESNAVAAPKIPAKKSPRKGKVPPPLTLVDEPLSDEWEDELIPLPRLLSSLFSILIEPSVLFSIFHFDE